MRTRLAAPLNFGLRRACFPTTLALTSSRVFFRLILIQNPPAEPPSAMSKAAPARPEPVERAAKSADHKPTVSANGAAVAAASAARDKNIELALSSITKQFGEGSIMRL